jgi:3-oxoacyl-[acyl-carrier protein] reductase
MKAKYKIALITGGTRGIGRAIAYELWHRDVRLFLNYANDEESAKQTLLELPKIQLLQADMSTFEGANKVYNKINKIDYVILNVGITDRTPFGAVSIQDWDKVFRTNLSIPFFLLQALKDKINKNGRIVFITSISGIVPDSVSICYGVSKASENMLVQYLAKEFAPKKITVNAIAPGYVMTDWHRNKTGDQMERIANKTLLKRFASPEEIAKAVMMLIENDYITGQIIRVDGGFGLC